MKIKTDFITNSSTVNFIISCPIEVTKNDLNTSAGHVIENFEVFTKMEELIRYTQADDCDWITKVRGPYRYWNLQKDWYVMCKQIILDGDIAYHMAVNNNYWDEMDRMENLFRNKGGSILLREHD